MHALRFRIGHGVKGCVEEDLNLNLDCADSFI